MKNVHLAAAIACLAIVVGISDALLWMMISGVGGKANQEDSVEGYTIARHEADTSTDSFMCARADWCGVDFTRLAAHPETLVGKRVFILGYLAVDSGIVSLFASEEDYARMESGRSLEIGGNRRDLTALVKAHRNSYVRIEGGYVFPRTGRGRSGRLGTLMPPLVVREVHARLSEQAADDILVRLGYPDGIEEDPRKLRGN